jgi:hypothetical protein
LVGNCNDLTVTSGGNDAHLCKPEIAAATVCRYQTKVHSTVARCPNFPHNNCKQAPTNFPWTEKIGGRKMTKFFKKWQKTCRNTFLQLLTRTVTELYAVSWQMLFLCYLP